MTNTSKTVIADGVLKTAYGICSAILPSACPQNHASNLLELPDGTLLCTWFGGTQEGIPDISIYLARLEKGATCWSKPEKLSNDPDRSEQNPVLFLAPDDTLWLLWTAQISGNQDTAIVRYRQSRNQGRTWGEIQTLLDQPGTFIRQPILINQNGDWLLPVFYCVAAPGEKWVGNNDTSAVKISSDQGKTWHDISIPDSIGCVHMNIVSLQDGNLVAFYRSRWADNIYRSESKDGGQSWSAPQALILPNNNSSIQATILSDGKLALVYNHSSAANAAERRTSLYDEIENDDDDQTITISTAHGKTAFWGAPRAPMTLALSSDGGRSWQTVMNLDEGDGYCMTNNSLDKLNRELSYPSIIEGNDGNLHISYTYFRQAIKYVRLNLTSSTL